MMIVADFKFRDWISSLGGWFYTWVLHLTIIILGGQIIQYLIMIS